MAGTVNESSAYEVYLETVAETDSDGANLTCCSVCLNEQINFVIKWCLYNT